MRSWKHGGDLAETNRYINVKMTRDMGGCILAILEEYMEVRLNSQNVMHYEVLGYEIPRRKDSQWKMKTPLGTIIRVKTNDLPSGSNVRVTKVCDVCGNHITEQKYQDILRKRNNGVDTCKSCASALSKSQQALQNAREGNNLTAKYPEIVELWHPTLNGDITPSEVTPQSNKRAWWLCTEDDCGHEWEVPISGVTRGSRCPVCSLSHGERQIREYLRFLGYKFTVEESMDGLFGEGGCPLRYDVAVKFSDGTYALLIEFDGKQHNTAVDHFGGEAQLARQQEHDRRKDEYALANNIPLLRIKHNEYDFIERLINEAMANIIRGEHISG